MELPESPDLVERAIRDAQDEGVFDDLPGAGKPIPDIDRPYDAGWWARAWMERDRAATLVNDLVAKVRREVPRALGMRDRERAHARLEELNAEIDSVNLSGASSEPIPHIDVEAMLAKRWM